MKKYEKPAIEEHAMGVTMPLMASVFATPAPGKEGALDDEDDNNGFAEDW